MSPTGAAQRCHHGVQLLAKALTHDAVDEKLETKEDVDKRRADGICQHHLSFQFERERYDDIFLHEILEDLVDELWQAEQQVAD